MSKSSWIRKLFGYPPRQVRRASSRRLGLEALEDRTVLSVTFTHFDQNFAEEFPGIQDRQVGGAMDMAVADFNGDGRLDLAFASTSVLRAGSLPGVEIYSADGFIDPLAGFPTTGENNAIPVSLAVADFNNDGRPDLVVGDEFYQFATVLMNTSLGGEFSFGGYTELSGASELLAAGDIDGDGKADLVTAGFGASTVTVRRGNGDGTFGSEASYTVGSAIQFMTMGDVNGDGRADLLVTSAGAGSVSVLRGQADGSLAAAASYSVGAGPVSVAVGDVNGDGKIDLLSANASDDSVSVLLGNGDGTFQAGVTLSVGDDPRHIAVSDFNGDGKADLAVAQFGTNTVRVLLGRGNGTFKFDTTLQTSAGPFRLAVANFDQDNRPDLVVLSDNSASPMAGFFIGNGTSFFTPGAVHGILSSANVDFDGDGYRVLDMVITDFNGDGRPDLASINTTRNAISVRLGMGDGTLGDVMDIAYPTGAAPFSMTAGDFDDDGHIDLITGNSTSISWLRGKGDGTFHNPATYSFNTTSDYFPEPLTFRPLEIVVGDFDGDGHSDLAMRFTAFASARQIGPGLGVGVVLGNGDGTFHGNGDVNGLLSPYLYLHDLYNPGNIAPYQSYLLGSKLAVGDLDGDGRSDLVVSAVGGNYGLYVFRGRANGTLELTDQYATSHLVNRSMVMADVNGDGWLDLAASINGTIRLWLNNGDGTLGTAVNIADSDNIFAFGDLNGDGRLDLINGRGGAIEVGLGRGNGTFEAPFRDVANSAWIGVGQFDADGRLDVVAGNQWMLNLRPPVTLSNSSVLEQQPIGTLVGTFHTDDPSDPDNFFQYEFVSGLGGGDNAEFTIDVAGNLRTAAVFDYLMENSYSIRVRSTDSVGVVTEKVFTISITRPNSGPTNIGLSNASMPENQPVGTTVGTFSTTDPDSGDSHTYTLVAGTGADDNAAFTIDASGNLKTAAEFDFEAKSSYSIRVRSTDSGGQSFEKVFTISVTNVNEAPTNIGLSNASVPENQPVGTTVGTFSTTDPDSGDSHTYTLVAGTGADDNAAFTIDASGNLKTAAVFDFEAKSSYSIRVRSTDSGGQSFEKVFTISVTNVNEAPTLTVPAAQIAYEDVDKAITGITVGNQNDGSLAVTLAVRRGKLTLGTTAGLTVTGNGTRSVTLSGGIANLNAALATLLYRGNLNYSGADTLNISVSDGSLSTNGSVAITVRSAAQQAADLRTQVTVLRTTGVLSNWQAQVLNVLLNRVRSADRRGAVAGGADRGFSGESAGLAARIG
jgi:hypothetical protein